MRPLIVALASVNTQTCQNLSLDSRIDWLSRTADRVFQVATERLGKKGHALSDLPLGLFVVPE